MQEHLYNCFYLACVFRAGFRVFQRTGCVEDCYYSDVAVLPVGFLAPKWPQLLPKVAAQSQKIASLPPT